MSASEIPKEDEKTKKEEQRARRLQLEEEDVKVRFDCPVSPFLESAMFCCLDVFSWLEPVIRGYELQKNGTKSRGSRMNAKIGSLRKSL